MSMVRDISQSRTYILLFYFSFVFGVRISAFMIGSLVIEISEG